jgi:hypothetical protein
MIEQRILTLRILHFALLMSVGMYAFVLWQVHPPQNPLPAPILYAFGVVALGIMVMIPVLRGKLLPPMREAHSLDEKLPEGPQVSGALAKLFAASIVSWAMCESIAIFGLMASFMSGDLKYFFAFAGVSLVNFVIYRPSREQLLSVARAAV